jgi:hypothetical protein
MKKKLIFFGIVTLALVLTTGTFAYTYTYSDTTLGAYLSDGPFATYQVSALQPDWNSTLPEGEYASDILVPNDYGDDTEIPSQFPGEGAHWDKVAEQPADDYTTYVSTEGYNTWAKDLYNLTDAPEGSANPIDKITVFFRVASGGSYNVKAMAAIITNDQLFEGPTETISGTDFVTLSWECAVNPYTEEPWTWDEINALQAGVTARGSSKSKPAIITQVYVQVGSVFTSTEGEVPTGDLFKVNPNPDYYGDLLVKIYLTNTASLLKAYQYLNMKVYVTDSIEAGETLDYQILSIETGVVMFNIVGGTAADYNVKVAGGSYRLVSDNPENWGDGWTVTPEFYCEVSQR